LARTYNEDIGGERRGVNNISSNHNHPMVGNCKEKFLIECIVDDSQENCLSSISWYMLVRSFIFTVSHFDFNQRGWLLHIIPNLWMKMLNIMYDIHAFDDLLLFFYCTPNLYHCFTRLALLLGI